MLGSKRDSHRIVNDGWIYGRVSRPDTSNACRIRSPGSVVGQFSLGRTGEDSPSTTTVTLFRMIQCLDMFASAISARFHGSTLGPVDLLVSTTVFVHKEGAHDGKGARFLEHSERQGGLRR